MYKKGLRRLRATTCLCLWAQNESAALPCPARSPARRGRQFYGPPTAVISTHACLSSKKWARAPHFEYRKTAAGEEESETGGYGSLRSLTRVAPTGVVEKKPLIAVLAPTGDVVVDVAVALSPPPQRIRTGNDKGGDARCKRA